MVDVGEYEVLMTVSQDTSAGDGFTQPYIGGMPALSYKFKATINPCSTTLTATTKVTTITYTIGDPSLTTGTYVFAETPVCGYALFVDLTNLPYFTVHNRASKDFTVHKTENRALAGTTTVTIKGYITEPDDYTTATYTERSDSYNFDIVMIDPCATTVIDTYTINDMQTSVFGVAA